MAGVNGLFGPYVCVMLAMLPRAAGRMRLTPEYTVGALLVCVIESSKPSADRLS